MFLISCYPAVELEPPAIVDFPLGTLEISSTSIGAHIAVRLSEDVSDSVVIDPDLFGDFWPSITHKQATERFGEPMSVRTTSTGAYSSYRTGAGVVEIAHELTGSSSDSRSWVLRAYPDSQGSLATTTWRASDVILDQTIASRIAASGRSLHVTIMNPNGTPGKEVVARGGRILYVIWLNPPGGNTGI